MKRGSKKEMTILMWNETCKICYKNGPTPASFSFIIGLFKQTIQFLQQINVKISIWHRDSNPQPFKHESSPITTRPRLPPLTCKVCY